LDRARAIALLDELHQAQKEFYAGGESTALRKLLTPDITWIVPGDSRIAGSYHGLDEVFDYFRRRREFANGTFQMHRSDILVGDGDRLAALTDHADLARRCQLLEMPASLANNDYATRAVTTPHGDGRLGA
jgi:SnoaL-like domain